MKKLIAILLALLTMCAVAQAADGSVSYVGGAEKFVFLPGSKWSDSDMFDNFKGVMPGDVLTQMITVTNNSDRKVRIYMRAEGSNARDQEFLNQLHLNVKSGSTEIFDAQADEKAQLTKETLLGTFKKKGSTELTVTLEVPIDLDSKFMTDPERGYIVPWTFMVEEVPDDPTPQTGDWYNSALWICLGVALAAALIVVLAAMKRRRKEEN